MVTINQELRRCYDKQESRSKYFKAKDEKLGEIRVYTDNGI